MTRFNLLIFSGTEEGDLQILQMAVCGILCHGVVRICAFERSKKFVVYRFKIYYVVSILNVSYYF